MKKTKERDYQASVVIHDLPSMTPRKIQKLALWLVGVAKTLNKEAADPKIFSKKFTARYMSPRV